jgi:ATP-dependent Clp protease adapter protein ClpS
MQKAPEKPLTISGVDMASLHERYCVEALNNDISTFDDVIKVFTQVCKYDAAKAQHYTVKIHTEGRAICFWAGKEHCETVIKAFKAILVKCRLIEI